VGQDSHYSLFRHYFQRMGAMAGNDPGIFRGHPVEEYADTMVESYFSQNLTYIETDAVVALNVWMATIHELHEVTRGCTSYDKDTALKALDKAVALWIGGTQQQSESSARGYLLYDHAETIGVHFGQLENEEALVNQRVLEFFNSLQTNLYSDFSCLPGFENRVIREEVQSLVGVMTIPLIQNLIHHIMSADNIGRSDFIELYALSVAPRVAACNPNLQDFVGTLNVSETADITEKYAAVTVLQSVYSCLRVSCDDIGTYEGDLMPTCGNDSVDGISLAGYTSPRTSALRWSYLDRDILQIRMLMEARAYEAALDLYMYGHNSDLSLQQLALNKAIPHAADSPFDLFRTYYQTDTYNFVDSKIIAALQLKSPYNQASQDQLTELVVGLLKYVVVHLSVLASLHFAGEECWKHNTGSALDYWDIGVALLIGSIEGSGLGGQQSGQLLYATAKENCGQFETCDSSNNDAFVNQMIVDALKTALISLENSDCQSVNSTLQTQISKKTLIPLIQGTLSYAYMNDGLPVGSPDGILATGFAYAQSVLPYLNIVSKSGAVLIERNMALQFKSPPVADGFLAIADVFRGALVGMGIDCSDIGSLGARGLCVGQNAAFVADIALPRTDLAFGRYNFTAQAMSELYSSFALDIRDIVQANTINDARITYRYGSNALGLDSSQVATTLNLASFSIDASEAMSQDPMFNIFKFALYDEATLDVVDDFKYADEAVTEALERASDVNLAADGVVVLHVWMMIAHKLYSSVRQCKEGINAQGFIDSAVALWIGKEQLEAGTSGWMLYAVGQTAAMNFGHDGEASTNSQLMIQFNEMQRVAGQCTEDSNVHFDLRLQVSETIRLLSIPLLQQLLFHIVINDRWHVELYAMSVISQLVACHPQAYMELSEILYSGFTPEKVGDDFVDHLVTFMECRRISCEDVTTSTAARADLQDFIAQICRRLDHRANTASIRGYVPSTDVREQSRIDLDILQIGIFMRMEAREAALDLYMNGHNSLSSSNSPGGSRNVTVSLHSLATSVERARSLNFEMFSDYYGTDAYADDLIQKCFAREYPLNGTSPAQLAALVTSSLQAMVSYRIILAKLQVSVEKCNHHDRVGAQTEWDAAVATFVGFIDMAYPGRNPHSSGKLMYSLGLEHCQYFSTCQETGEALSNVALLKHFANGKDLVVDGECSLAESRIASNIAPLMQTLIIQGTLQYSIEKENLEAASKESLTSGFVLAKAIQPLVNHVNATSARTLAMSFEFPLSNVSTQDGAENVFDAFRYVLRNMSIDCGDIGQALGRPDLNVCFGASKDDIHSTLGIELYVPTSLSMQQTNIAMDVAEMTKALSDGMPSVAKMIYSTGKNSKIFDDSGQFMKMRTLRGLSVNSTLEMLSDPLFNIFMFALQTEGGNNGAEQVDGRRLLVETREYADGIVQDALDSLEANNSTLASEASVVLNVWMYTAHLLYNAVRECRKEEITDGEGGRAIDEAAAFWIGDGQGFQEVDGHLLYGVAEAMGRVFNTVEQGQSRSNRNILNLLKDAKGHIMSCSGNPASIAQLHVTINKIISMMMVPLVQGLIHNLNVNDPDRVKVFAYAFVPMTAGCSSETFKFLRNKLIDLTYDPLEIMEIVDRIYQLLPCLNLRCEDIGIHSSNSQGNPGNDTQGNHEESAWSTSTCLDAPLLVPMASYHPASNVIAVSHDDVPKLLHICALPLTQ
jgi:hypothetical protein